MPRGNNGLYKENEKLMSTLYKDIVNLFSKNFHRRQFWAIYFLHHNQLNVQHLTINLSFFRWYEDLGVK